MSNSRKISVRKIIQTLVTLLAVTGCTMAMLSADRQQRKRTVRDVKLKISGPDGVQFLTEDVVRQTLFTTRHLDPRKVAVARLDERSMEAILQSNPWVRDAQVFTDAERVMHVHVTQRVPVVRLFEEDGNSYYLDTALKAMPLSARYTHYAPVVTGVPHLQNDSVGNVTKGTILSLVRYITHHSFWKDQISQMVMRGDGGFELVPVLGRQRIIIGDTARLDDKLGNLFAFYRQVQNKVGWDRYETIDLRYEGQVVASPALPWKAPVDRAISNMNWLKAIMDGAPARQDQPGGDASAFPDTAGAVAAPQPKAATASAVPKAAAPVQKAAARPAVRTAIVPKSPAPRKPKLPQNEARKKPAASPVKKTPSNVKNTKPHAATNR